MEFNYGLDKMLYPCTKDLFLKDYFEQTSLHIKRNDQAYPGDMPRLDEVLTLLAKAPEGIKFNITLEGISGKLADETWLSLRPFANNVQYRQAVNLDAILHLFASGEANIILSNLGGDWKAVDELNASIVEELSCGCDAVLCLTPANGFVTVPKFETADMLIFQIVGERTWKVYKGPIALPLSSQGNTPFELQNLPKVDDYLVLPGDVVYIPRGFVYEQVPTDEISLFVIFRLTYITNLRLILDILKGIGMTKDNLRKGMLANSLHENDASIPGTIAAFSGALDEKLTRNEMDSALRKRRFTPRKAGQYDLRALKTALHLS